MSRDFRFDGEWELPLVPDRVHTRLLDLERYPTWWPEIRAVAKLGDDDALVLVRSALPITLELVLHAESRSSDRLETTLSGDLQGWVRWLIDPISGGAGPHTRLRFEQEVRVARRGLSWASYVVRPVLVWNHDRMVASAVRGLLDAAVPTRIDRGPDGPPTSR